MRAAGDTFIPAMVMSFFAVINFFLDPLLIFGLFGFPAMGVTGAALATLIAYIMGAGVGLYILVTRKNLIALDGLHLDKFKDSMKRLLVIALPAGLANVIVPASSAVITAILAVHGSEAVAAFGVVSRIEAVALLVGVALAVGVESGRAACRHRG